MIKKKTEHEVLFDLIEKFPNEKYHQHYLIRLRDLILEDESPKKKKLIQSIKPFNIFNIF